MKSRLSPWRLSEVSVEFDLSASDNLPAALDAILLYVLSENELKATRLLQLRLSEASEEFNSSFR
jgi:hypothetical protein